MFDEASIIFINRNYFMFFTLKNTLLIFIGIHILINSVYVLKKVDYLYMKIINLFYSLELSSQMQHFREINFIIVVE